MIIGVDAGGTNVDGVLMDEGTIAAKAKSPLNAPRNAIHDVLDGVLNGTDPDRIDRVVVATTLLLNAAVEDRLPDCSNVLIPGPGLSPGLASHGEENIVCSGCVDHRGRITEDLDLPRSPSHSIVAVTGKFASRNPELEREAAERLGERPDQIALSHEAGGRLGFPNRAATTVFNAKGKEIIESLTADLREIVEDLGLDASLFYLKGDAGMLSAERIQKAPSHTVRGGPAASALGLLALSGERHAVCVDVGGTTTDLTFVREGFPVLEEGYRAGDGFSMYRVVASSDLAVGGDTVVTAEDWTGRREGPAAAFGGDHPTPTDALHVCGAFEGGDVEAARRAMGTLGDPDRVSKRIVDEMVEHICTELNRMAERFGERPETLLAGGVLAPALVGRIAERLDWVKGGRAPRHADVAGAVGCAAARVSLETRLHIDSAQGVMTVSFPGQEKQRHVRKGRTYEEDDLRKRAKQEAAAAANEEGGRKDTETEVTSFRVFNVVQQGHRKGQIADMTAQVVPGVDPFVCGENQAE